MPNRTRISANPSGVIGNNPSNGRAVASLQREPPGRAESGNSRFAESLASSKTGHKLSSAKSSTSQVTAISCKTLSHEVCKLGSVAHCAGILDDAIFGEDVES